LSKKITKLTTDVVNCSASVWGVGLGIHGGGVMQKIAGQGDQFPSSYANKNIAKLTMWVINCPAVRCGMWCEV